MRACCRSLGTFVLRTLRGCRTGAQEHSAAAQQGQPQVQATALSGPLSQLSGQPEQEGIQVQKFDRHSESEVISRSARSEAPTTCLVESALRCATAEDFTTSEVNAVESSDEEGTFDPELDVTESGLYTTRDEEVPSGEGYNKKEKKEARKRIRRSHSCVSRGESVYKEDPPIFLAPTPKGAPAVRREVRARLLERLRADQALSDEEGDPTAASSSSRPVDEPVVVDNRALGVILHETVVQTSRYARKVVGASRKEKKALITEARTAIAVGFTCASKSAPSSKKS